MSNKELVNQKRRAILGGAAVAVTGITIAPGVFLTETAQARPLDEPVSSKNRWEIGRAHV